MTIYPPVHRLGIECVKALCRLFCCKANAFKANVETLQAKKSDCDMTKVCTEAISTDVLIHLKDKHIRASL